MLIYTPKKVDFSENIYKASWTIKSGNERKSNQLKKFDIMVALTILLYTLMNHSSGLFLSLEQFFNYLKLTVYFNVSEIPMKCSAYIYIQFAKSLLRHSDDNFTNLTFISKIGCVAMQ